MTEQTHVQVKPVNGGLKSSIWVVFGLTNVVSIWAAYFMGFVVERHILLATLICLSGILGVAVLWLVRGRRLATVTTLSVFLIGQIWWIDHLVAQLLWSMNGFAP